MENQHQQQTIKTIMKQCQSEPKHALMNKISRTFKKWRRLYTLIKMTQYLKYMQIGCQMIKL